MLTFPFIIDIHVNKKKEIKIVSSSFFLGGVFVPLTWRKVSEVAFWRVKKKMYPKIMLRPWHIKSRISDKLLFQWSEGRNKQGRDSWLNTYNIKGVFRAFSRIIIIIIMASMKLHHMSRRAINNKHRSFQHQQTVVGDMKETRL